MEPEADGSNVTYPSPGAEALESGPFYNTGGREGVQEHQEGHHDHVEPHHEQHHEQPEHQVPEQVRHVQVQEHGQSELQQPEQESIQHHVSRPANLEELQLAAQLGQGLAGTSMMPATDPNMNVEDPNLRNIMPHPEPDQQQTPSYVHDTPTSDPMVSHPMSVQVGPSMSSQYPIDNSIPPRKRSKVSRACDECRRKKIKCDAQSDTGDAPCSSCARSSIRCLFSRVPQKRGPSKGYIKELADRIHSIENKLESDGGLSQDDIDRLFVTDRPRPSQGEDSARKRPFSSISTNDFATPSRQTPWGSEPHRIQASPGTSEPTYGSYDNSSLAPHPGPLKPEISPSKPPVATMDVSMPDAHEAVDIDEGMLHSYLSSFQPVYPILPSTKGRMQELLAQCPTSLQNAFANALPAVVGSGDGDIKHADSLLSALEQHGHAAATAVNIVHLQTLLLLTIDADLRSSATLPFTLSRAVALAGSMRLWRFTPIESITESDSDDALCARLWWSLILIDRWHATGTGRPSYISDNSVVAPPGLENILGEVCFYLVRLSKLLNRLWHAIFTLQPGASTTEEHTAKILADYIENYREDLPAHIEPASHPMVHMAYWHCRLIIILLTPGATSSETLWATKELVNLLSANDYLRSPLVNHFVSLVYVSLAKLIKMDRSREEATQLIKDVVDKPATIWDIIREKLAEQLRPTSSVEASTASQGLQHLADLATAHEGGDDIAFGPSLALGYLEMA
ncbi:n-terminal binuclear zn cluster-containing DNA-containing protein [Fusarium flagelliforme]|uniref:N-terminal binuclear zn cluster-containing DNA-containing protein n=2 Tax=Fusarium flagelliforme TaxID=2675880 RepID=A0A395MEC6_9HYPO|nr:n-terminal binuclear zn cluster-containing DNA-containing protein [Fusarium flagelliforme]